MRGFNKVVMMGNLTRDPELRTTPSGQNVTSFSLAVNRSWKNAQGETQEAVDYIDCNVWGKPAEIVNQYMKKGSGILVSGRLQQRSWEQEGQKRSKVEVVVEDFNFVGGDRDGGGGGSSSSSASSSAPAASKKSEPVVEDIGDEPKMYKQKHPDIEVAVHADRVEGVYLILQDEPDTQLILMDDGFQHRRIKAGYNILLTTFDKPFYKDYLLPAGNLREHRSAVRRAQTVIVTKCPDTITEEQMTEMRTAIQRYKQLPVHFTRYTYLQPRPLFADQPMQSIPAQSAVTLLTGIAGNWQLKAYLNKQYSQIMAMAFADHHYFTASDLQRIAAQTQDGIIITTEKDAMRLMEVRESIDALQLAIFVQPVAVECISNEQALLHDIETWLSTMQTAAV